MLIDRLPRVQQDDFPIELNRSFARYAAFQSAADRRAKEPDCGDDDLEFEMALDAIERQAQYIATCPAMSIAEVLAKTKIFIERQIAHELIDRTTAPDSVNDFKLLASIYQDLTRLAAQEPA